ncbi:nucleosome assembly protein 1;2-like isoform X2 [Silene latifolia]|uniref:nucleosome assembly protein 1;2-like isoform X2 n=1 Tax=Silene latifolia TaxID=37657 RepID=UPI003D776DD9
MSSNINDAINLSDLGAALTSETLLNVIKNAAFLENLSPNVSKRVEVLKQIQSEHDELEAKFFEERRALENKYQKLYQPLYTKRYDIVNGVVEVDGVSNEPAEQGEDKLAQEKGVPDFWLTAMKSNEVLAESIQEQDEEALKYLKDIKWYRVTVPKDDNKKGEATEGFKLEFFFDPNPYFKNSVLTKTYFMIDEDEPLLEKAIGTEIEWLPGKCLTEKILKKKPKRGSKNTKPITKTETVDSFFNFFSPPEVPDEDEEIEEEAAEELQSLMEQDYDIGSAIREKIIPHAVSWFTGEAALDDELGDLDDLDDEEDDDDDEDEDEEEDDDDDDDDDEEDEDDDKTNSHKKGNAKAQKADAQQVGEKPPECKQQ